MHSIEEILRELESIKERGGNVDPFLKKWAHILYPVLEMVPIPSGMFQMGSENGRYDEKPVHTVKLSAFKIAKYPVTYRQWLEVKEWAEKNGYQFPNQGRKGYGEKTDENHPVTYVSWYDAVLWCNALSGKEGRKPCYYNSPNRKEVYRSGEKDMSNDYVDWEADGYRLPTEAEWEYACRAGTTTEYSFGDSITKQQANFDNSGGGTSPVGYYILNNWELGDMHGNVWEWCWDRYDSNYYQQSPDENPRGPSGGSDRVLRGGSWIFGAAYLRSADRDCGDPVYAGDDGGFRPVCPQFTGKEAEG